MANTQTDWFDENAPADADWFAPTAPSDVLRTPAGAGSQTTYPLGEELARSGADLMRWATDPRTLNRAIPSVGGALGGVAGFAMGGPPGAIGGAFAGGGLGELLRQIAAGASGIEAPSPPDEATRRIWQEGAMQGLGEGAGRFLAHRARTSAGHMMENALRETIPSQQQSLRRAAQKAGRFVPPAEARMARVNLDVERIPVGKMGGGEAGSVILNRRIGASADRLNAILADAGAGGKRFTVQNFTTEIGRLRQALARRTDAVKALDKLDAQLSDLMKAHRQPGKAGRIGPMTRLTPEEAQKLKQTWQEAAKTIYNKEAARKFGTVPPLNEQVSAEFNRSMASGARKALEGIDPEIGILNQKIADQSQLLNAILRAEMRNRPPLRLNEPVTWPMVGALASPELQSRAALLLTEPAFQELVRQSPRTAHWLLRLSEQEGQQ
jgi:hypothetical protein